MILLRLFALVTPLVLMIASSRAAEIFRVATYNLEGYLETSAGTRPKKSEQARSKIRQSIRSIDPDVLALQELGSVAALLELRDSLKAEGLDLAHWQYVSGSDTNIHIAVLSKFPFTARRTYTNESYLLGGRRFHISRGFMELEIQVNSGYAFSVFTAHFKSKRAIPQADETQIRQEEARLLREKIDAHLAANPERNLVVLGDFNDTKDALSTRILVGQGKHKLVDTRPAERNGDKIANPSASARKITWTLYYGKTDTFSRVDYIMLSAGMAREWLAQETYIATIADWGLASDHRPLVAGFEAIDR